MRLALLSVAIALLIASCKPRCDRPSDCGPGSYCSQHRCAIDCFTHEDCQRPVECRANPENCAPKGLFCSQHGKCVGRIDPRITPETPIPRLEKPTDGWSSPVGEGATFVLDYVEVAGPGIGFDLDQQGGIDNVLNPIGPTVNQSIQQGIFGGEVLLMLEIAGLDQPYTGDDDSVTLKVYGAIDADYPVDHFNNFELPSGHSGRCCEFKVDARWLTTENGLPQATVRAPAYIENYRLYAPRNYPHYSFDLLFVLTLGAPPHRQVTIANSRIEVDVDSDLTALRRGVLGGGVTVKSLAAISNPFCGIQGPSCPSGDSHSTLLDLTTFLAGPAPDVDVDADGRECVLDTNGDDVIDRCCDGEGAAVCSASDRACAGEAIAGDDSSDPSSCARTLEMTDGYSIGFEFSAVAARIVGTGTGN